MSLNFNSLGSVNSHTRGGVIHSANTSYLGKRIIEGYSIIENNLHQSPRIFTGKLLLSSGFLADFLTFGFQKLRRGS